MGVDNFPGRLYTSTTDPVVSINSEQIGGPSAGLMFSLEIYNQLTIGDLTKGYQIAGTGTLDEGGKGWTDWRHRQKIVATDHSGADIFFAPNEYGAANSNYQDALIAAKDIDSKMKIVPVDSFDKCMHYLEKLKKNSRKRLTQHSWCQFFFCLF